MNKITMCARMLSAASITAVLVLSGCGGQGSTGAPVKSGPGGPEVVRLHASFSVDVNDPAATVGDADYVFVARVDTRDETVYKNPVTIETEDGPKQIADPYTNFHVTVIENIKGELETGASIPLQKAGGVTEDGAMLVLYEHDALPEVGATYVFLAYAQDDGSLLVVGPNSTMVVDEVGDMSDPDEIIQELDGSQIVQTYEEAAEEQIFTDRDRSVSDHDATR